ncbi:MAG: adaptor protein MecA [Lachnospiraceae bacterium]|nr:adaptor protein MecA [Lachnospiraceae bacterium]
MKIELINESKIKCTLSREDLVSHNMVLTEFAYGSEKARAFFRDIMLQAEDELGFEAEDNIPLMIEAVPIGQDSLILFVTKVEDPEELDTRFSRFTRPSDEVLDAIESESEEDEEDDEDRMNLEVHVETNVDDGVQSTDELLDVVKDAVRNAVEGLARAVEVGQDGRDNFIPLNESAKKINTGKTDSDSPNKSKSHVAVFKFDSLDDVCNAAVVAYSYSHTDNTLYKDTVSGCYHLVVFSGNMSTDKFAKLCNILTEYGTRQHPSYAQVSYYEEHYMCVIRSNALQTLGA